MFFVLETVAINPDTFWVEQEEGLVLKFRS